MWTKISIRPIISNLRRGYNLHEYQSLSLLKSYGVETPYNKVAFSPREAQAIASEIGDANIVVKAQVLAGGRGKGKFEPGGFQGGVHIIPQSQVSVTAENMIGKLLITKQTGSSGKPCDKVLVMRKVNLSKEFYLSFLLDRKFGGPVMVYSRRGGMDIEDVAAKEPSEIFKVPISIHTGVTQEMSSEVTKNLNFPMNKSQEVFNLVSSLYKCFVEKDLLLLEINPLGVTTDGDIVVCDAKLNFDDNAIFRQKDTHQARDLRQENQDELEAHDAGLSYISMEGNIGCLVNGAGLAMATMDLIKLMGASPANFLDVGGGAQEDQIVSALKILQNNSKVETVLINIFGGIMRCDIIASGLITAVNKVNFQKPIVARLCGTNWQEAKKLILNSGVNVIYEPEEEAAVSKAVKISRILKLAKESGLEVTLKNKLV
jgi:succinyl-CoA synthetase beta subunit